MKNNHYSYIQSPSDEDTYYKGTKQLPHKKSSSRQKFTAEEDQLLEKLVDELGTHAWKKVSARMKTRSTRQCRERYNNYLAPNVTNGPWTAAEDALLEQKVQEMGQKWSKIAAFFEGRSDVNIKNRHALLVSKGLAVPGVSFHKGFKAKRKLMESKEQQKPVTAILPPQPIQTLPPQPYPQYPNQIQPVTPAGDHALYAAANDFLTKWFETQDQQNKEQPQTTGNSDWNKLNFDFETEWLLNQQLSDPNSIFCAF